MTSKELYEWRQQGATYQEMADAEGVSRQDIYMKVKSYEAKLKGHRGRRFEVNEIVYKGLYDYFSKDVNKTTSDFAEAIFGDASRVCKIRNFLRGENESTFKIKHIQKMIEITGKTFEELFERRKVK